MLIARTQMGVCAVSLGATDRALVAELDRRFPRARRVAGDAALNWGVAAVLPAIRGDGSAMVLALDVRATAFQRKVWGALAKIPAGQTRSYGEIAEQIGRPRAACAVAAACAANPVAVAIPCHRVVRADGALAGYRWGVCRKQALLKRERR